jgi:hypothetical protein
LFEPERFLQKNIAIGGQILSSGFEFSAHPDYGQPGAAGPQGGNGGFSIHYRHLEIAKDQRNVALVLAEKSQRFSAVSGAQNAVSMLPKGGSNHFAQGSVIVNKQDQFAMT